LGVDLEVVWSVIDLDLPGLRDALEHASDGMSAE
jgi:uncharacterized protein with HEPN domain